MTNTPCSPEFVDALLNEIAQMTEAFTDLRMRYANLTAAARAALIAQYEGESDPLSYVADELAAHGQLPPVGTARPQNDADTLVSWLSPQDVRDETETPNREEGQR